MPFTARAPERERRLKPTASACVRSRLSGRRGGRKETWAKGDVDAGLERDPLKEGVRDLKTPEVTPRMRKGGLSGHLLLVVSSGPAGLQVFQLQQLWRFAFRSSRAADDLVASGETGGFHQRRFRLRHQQLLIKQRLDEAILNKETRTHRRPRLFLLHCLV